MERKKTSTVKCMGPDEDDLWLADGRRSARNRILEGRQADQSVGEERAWSGRGRRTFDDDSVLVVKICRRMLPPHTHTQSARQRHEREREREREW